MAALLKDKTCHPSHMLGMKQSCGLRETSKIRVRNSRCGRCIFFWVYLHTFMAKASVILELMSAKYSLPPEGVCCLLLLGFPLELCVQPLSEQWVQTTQSQCTLLGVGASTSSCGCEGCRKDKNWRRVFCVVSSRRILQLFWPGKMCGEDIFLW